MKVFILILTILISSNAYAFQVTLQWKPNIEPDLSGYRVYYGHNSRKYTKHDNVELGNCDSSRCEYKLEIPPGKWFFAVTAYNNSLESNYSNEVSTSFGAQLPWLRLLIDE